jgi:hypothetical protein
LEKQKELDKKLQDANLTIEKGQKYVDQFMLNEEQVKEVEMKIAQREKNLKLRELDFE